MGLVTVVRACGLGVVAGAMLLAACTHGDRPAGAGGTSPDWAPTGARIEASGHATVLQAPSPEYPHAPPPPDDRPLGGEAAWYARDQGIGEEEAKRRLDAQAALQVEYERLLATLQREEAGNFTAARLVHGEDWAYVFHFKREPAATLARHTRNPRFRAAPAPYTRAELDALLAPWAERFRKAGILGAYGSDETLGTVEMMISVTRADYERLAAREGWTLPPAIRLEFAPDVRGPAVDPRAARFVRVFAQSDKATGILLSSATSGRIVLEDGCLRVLRPGQRPALAYFAREAALAIDAQGYLAVGNRIAQAPVQPQPGRIGEVFVWGGYGEVSEGMAMVAELRRQCGGGPIVHVGNPESLHHFRVRPWALDEYARRRSISREQAWGEIKACWRRQDAAGQGYYGPECDVSP